MKNFENIAGLIVVNPYEFKKNKPLIINKLPIKIFNICLRTTGQ